MKDIVVGVTALTFVDSPQPGFGVARSLKHAGYKVIGINGQDLTAAICLPYFDDVKIVESLLEQDKKQFLKDLKEIKGSTGMSVFIPCFDTEVKFCISIRKHIEKLGIIMLLPSSDAFDKSTKKRLSELSDNIAMPPTVVAKNKKELMQKAKQVGWPQVCKGPYKDAYIAKNPDYTKMYCDQIKEWWGGGRGDVIIQKFMLGDFFAVSGVVDKKGNLASYVHMQKLGIDLKGATWSGQTVFNKKLHEISLTIIKELNWIGPFEFEFIKDEDDPNYYLFEVNPRLPGWIWLSTAAGENIPATIVLEALSNKNSKDIYTPGSYKKNIVFTRISEEVICSRRVLDDLYNLKRSTEVYNKGGMIELGKKEKN